MKKMVQLGVLLALVISLSHTANAGLLIEPLVGYQFGTATDHADEDASINGTAFGGRLGYQNLGFQLGVDYLNSVLNVEDNSEDLKTSEWGGFVGFQFPILFRAYAGYVFSGAGEVDTVDYLGGTGPKFGFGFTGLPFVSLNFEYRKISYEEIESSGVKIDTDTNYSAYLFSVSLPLNI